MDDFVYPIAIALCMVLFFFLKKTDGSGENEGLKESAFGKMIRTHQNHIGWIQDHR